MMDSCDIPQKLERMFSPIEIGGLTLPNRVVMAPMTRYFSPNGVPTDEVADYYARRSAADVGLIITEGTWINHPGAANDDRVPDFFGEAALAGWKKVVDAVHAEGAKIMPQLWHIGLMEFEPVAGVDKQHTDVRADQVGPSGYVGGIGKMPTLRASAMTQKDIDDVVTAFGEAAETALHLGFDGVAIHGAHGYLIDQFLWDVTNKREDRYGGDIKGRATFACEVIREIRRRTRPDFPIMFRFSQWKLQDYNARLVSTPEELAILVNELAQAGVDIFDCSERRFWVPVFEGSHLSLAGWTRKLTQKPTMTVGSVGLDRDVEETLGGEESRPSGIEALLDRLDKGEFDLVGVGRAVLVDPQWASKAKANALHTAAPFTPDALGKLF